MKIKTITLILAFILSLGFCKAQNIRYVGHGTMPSDTLIAVKAWNNGNLQYSITSDSLDLFANSALFYNDSTIIVGGHAIGADGVSYGRIWTGNAETLSATSGSRINDIAVKNDTIFGAGYRTIGTKTVASVWKDHALLYTLSNSQNDAKANAIIMVNGNILSGGFENNSASFMVAKIWQNDNVLYTLTDSTENACILDLTYDGTDLYAVGYIVDSLNQSKAVVWKNNELLYTLSDTLSMATAITAAYGDIYTGGWETSGLKIWKNGTELYSLASGNSLLLNAIAVNEYGVFAAGSLDGNGKIWQNGQELYSPDACQDICGISVLPSCNDSTRTLPWTDSFENGSTDWNCWTKTDIDTCNNGNESYWTRSMAQAATGVFSAQHLHADSIQEGWLISPQLYLQPNRDTTFMTFKSMETNPANYTYSGLWISTTGTSASDFTELWNVSAPSNTWDTVSIDLAAYQGQTVYLAFKYTGANGHDWYVDDISVQESFHQQDTVTSYPYAENFNSNLDDWYIIDEDHSGGLNNWKMVAGADSTYYAGHPQSPASFGDQECWMISKPLHLAQYKFYNMDFKTMTDSVASYDKSSVWIASNVNGTPKTDDFVQVWEETTPSETWRHVGIDLSDYANNDVYLAFKYEGNHAHGYFVDSISIAETDATYTITVLPNNNAWGTTTGSGTYVVNDTVQIGAIPNTNYEFISWDDNVTDNPRDVLVTENHTYTAIFGIIHYTITTGVTPEGAGTVVGGGTYEINTTVNLTATSNTGYYFTSWDDGTTTNPRSITVTENATYTAIFTPYQYTITTAANPVEGGTVAGGGTYDYGTAVSLVATPNANYRFLCWSDGVATNPRHVTVTQNATYTALFMENGGSSHTLTLLSNNDAWGTVAGGGTYPDGTEVQISATAASMAHFVTWDDGVIENPRTIIINSDITLTAQFALNQSCVVSIVSNNPLMGNTYGSGIFAQGSDIEIGAIANQGFYFNNWNDGNVENPRMIHVTGDTTLTAYFASEPVVTYTITVYYNDEQGIVLGGGTYVSGATARLAAIAKDGFEFEKWNDNNTDNPRNVIVNGDMTFVAFFKTNGIDDNTEAKLVIYPNPADENIHIKGIQANSKVYVYDAQGCMIMTPIVSDDEAIDISNLSAGCYFVRVNGYSMKFIKK